MIEVIVCLLPDVINSAGLAFDIGGVILLFCYGLPAEVSKSGGTAPGDIFESCG